MNTRLFRAITIALPIAIGALFAYRYFAVSGEMTVTYDFSTDEHPVVEPFEPGGRARNPEKNIVTGRTYQRIVGDPVYMDVHVPRSFESVDILVNYKNPDKQYAQFGVILNENPYSVRLAPFEVPVIDDARLQWHSIMADDGTQLLQREQQYDSVDSFIEQPPSEAAVGVYQTELPVHYAESNYAPLDLNEYTYIDHALRGSHTFVTYIDNEDLEVTFAVTDTNEHEGADDVKVIVTDRFGNRVFDTALEDDGTTDDSGYQGESRTLTAAVQALDAGTYTIQVQASNDVLLQSIRSAQKRFVVKDLVLLDDPRANAATIHTSADDLRLVTSTIDGVQEVVIQSAELESTVAVQEVHAPYTWLDTQTGSHMRAVRLAEDNMRLWSRGYFAFSSDAYFDPDYQIQNITEFTQLDDLDYILVQKYTSPDHRRLESTQVVSLNFDQMVGDRKELRFVLSSPGIDQSGAELTINDITFTFNREPFFERLWARIK